MPTCHLSHSPTCHLGHSPSCTLALHLLSPLPALPLPLPFLSPGYCTSAPPLPPRRYPGYRLEPSEVAALLQEVAVSSGPQGTLTQSQFIASQVDWQQFQVRQPCGAAGGGGGICPGREAAM